jgi:two-component system sensor histidine kinase KdpD
VVGAAQRGKLRLFFVEPRFSFAISDTEYLFTFTLILVVALATGQLAAGLREKAQVATAGERRATALARVARELSGAITVDQVAHVCAQTLALLLQVRVALIVTDEHGTLRTIGEADFVDASIAHWTFAHRQPAGAGTATLPGARALYLPLCGPIAMRGVIALVGHDGAPLADAGPRGLLDACCSLIALALERCHFIELAQTAQLRAEGERLRNALLSAVSHDLKTPLTAIGGLAETRERAETLTDEERRVVSRAIRLQTEGLHRLVINLLDLARMQGEGVRLNTEWHALAEIVGSAFARLGTALDGHRTQTSLASDLPLMELDAIAFERVLVNLIDNAAKYTPAGSTVCVRADAAGETVRVIVEDDGLGLPRIDGERLFEAFARGVKESSITGVGLGLALCRTIVEAHGGAIECENREPRGARFTISLPTSAPPNLLEEPAA